MNLEQANVPMTHNANKYELNITKFSPFTLITNYALKCYLMNALCIMESKCDFVQTKIQFIKWYFNY